MTKVFFSFFAKQRNSESDILSPSSKLFSLLNNRKNTVTSFQAIHDKMLKFNVTINKN